MVGPTRGVGAGGVSFPPSHTKHGSSGTIHTIFCIENTHTHLSLRFTARSTCGICMAILCAQVARYDVKASSRASYRHSMVPVLAELATTNYIASYLKHAEHYYSVSLIFEWSGLSPFLATPLGSGTSNSNDLPGPSETHQGLGPYGPGCSYATV